MAQSPDEKTYEEIPFIEQQKGMGWEHIGGDIDMPYLAEGIERKGIFQDNIDLQRLARCVQVVDPSRV
jgi:hypothetical protein